MCLQTISLKEGNEFEKRAGMGYIGRRASGRKVK